MCQRVPGRLSSSVNTRTMPFQCFQGSGGTCGEAQFVERPAYVPGALFLPVAVSAIWSSRMWRLAGGCVAAAAASLLVAGTPGFDAWGWVLWGRELTGHGSFSTVAYPSWKPLPAIVDAGWAAISPSAVAGLWLVTARAAGLFALVLAGRLAARLGGRAAAVLAVAGLAAAPGWWTMLVAGASEPLLSAHAPRGGDPHPQRRQPHAFAPRVVPGPLRP